MMFRMAGISNEPFNALGTNGSVTAPQNPRNIRANYGSSDYDARHYFSANFMLTDVFRQAGLRRGAEPDIWRLDAFGKLVFPDRISIYDRGQRDLWADCLASTTRVRFSLRRWRARRGSCGNAVDSPCLNASQFVSSADASSFGTIGRNTIYGPHFFDVDLALMKSVALGERVTFSFGAQAYNIFNHPNFDQPVGDIASPLFGSTIATVGPPTSLLGAFNGAGSSPRFVEIKGTVRF